ncbi:cytochrome P450 [Artemisia annua]|uniref:Cytochrome P450 n=1 Tax=Artemisia annua TaxID=35608 RepID=A0A2U1N9F7_ARTAN|nr:cytochrome P450 [Artemisia annua]
MYIYISLSLFVASYLLTTHFRHKIYNLPPTIFPTLPIIGHLYLLKSPLYRTFAKISDKYGPIILLNFGSRRVLLVSSPSISEECFTKNDIVFANRPNMLFGKILGNNFTSMVWAPYGDHWRNLRRLAATEILSNHRLNEFQEIRSNESRLMVHKLMLNSSPVNMKLVFYEFTLNVMMRMISGKRYFGGDIPEVAEEGKRFKMILDEAFSLAGLSKEQESAVSPSSIKFVGRPKRTRLCKTVNRQQSQSTNWEEQEPNPHAKEMYQMLQAADEPLWNGCQKLSRLEVATHALNWKSEYNISESAYNGMLQMWKCSLPDGAKLVGNFYETKKSLRKVNLPVKKIHACKNHFMLFYENHSSLTHCLVCKASRYSNDGRYKENMATIFLVGIANGSFKTGSSSSIGPKDRLLAANAPYSGPIDSNLSIFKVPSKRLRDKSGKDDYFTNADLLKAHTYILLNCEEVMPTLCLFNQWVLQSQDDTATQLKDLARGQYGNIDHIMDILSMVTSFIHVHMVMLCMNASYINGLVYDEMGWHGPKWLHVSQMEERSLGAATRILKYDLNLCNILFYRILPNENSIEPGVSPMESPKAEN